MPDRKPKNKCSFMRYQWGIAIASDSEWGSLNCYKDAVTIQCPQFNKVNNFNHADWLNVNKAFDGHVTVKYKMLPYKDN